MNPHITSWIIGSVVSCLLLSAPVYALEHLSEQELSTTTAQNGKAIEEEQAEQVLATNILLSTVNTIKKAVPIHADIEVEGMKLDGQDALISEENTTVEKRFKGILSKAFFV